MLPGSSPRRRAARLLPARPPRDGAVRYALRRIRARAADESGISIMELLVSMVILIILVTALSTVIVEASSAEVRTNRTFQAQVQGGIALSKVRRELHCASTVSVVNASAQAVAAGVAGNQIRAQIGGYCPTNGLTSTATTPVYVTWCTLASTLKTGDYALYRLASTSSYQSCANTGVKWADYLTTATPFCVPTTAAACSGVYRSATSLQTVHVNFPVNLFGASSARKTFTLVDDIALRNSVRG